MTQELRGFTQDDHDRSADVRAGKEMKRVFEYFNSVPIDVLWETSFRHGVITKLFLARDPIPAAFHEIVCRALLAIETPFDAVLED